MPMPIHTHTHTHIWMCIYTFVYMHQGDSQQAVFLCLFCSAGSIHCGAVRGLVIVGGPRGNWRWEGPLGTPLGLVHWKRASSPVEAGTAGYL